MPYVRSRSRKRTPVWKIILPGFLGLFIGVVSTVVFYRVNPKPFVASKRAVERVFVHSDDGFADQSKSVGKLSYVISVEPGGVLMDDLQSEHPRGDCRYLMVVRFKYPVQGIAERNFLQKGLTSLRENSGIVDAKIFSRGVVIHKYCGPREYDGEPRAWDWPAIAERIVPLMDSYLQVQKNRH